MLAADRALVGEVVIIDPAVLACEVCASHLLSGRFACMVTLVSPVAFLSLSRLFVPKPKPRLQGGLNTT